MFLLKKSRISHASIIQLHINFEVKAAPVMDSGLQYFRSISRNLYATLHDA